MKITLIRHTTPDILKGVCYGQSDIGVTPTFYKESAQIINHTGRFEKVFSSPLIRCTKLAELLSDNVVLDERLMELNFGDWESKRWSDIPENEIEPWYNDYVSTRTPNGESFDDLIERCRDFLEHLNLQDKNNLVCVTHAGVIRAMHCIINGTTPIEVFNLSYDYGCVVTLQ